MKTKNQTIAARCSNWIARKALQVLGINADAITNTVVNVISDDISSSVEDDAIERIANAFDRDACQARTSRLASDDVVDLVDLDALRDEVAERIAERAYVGDDALLETAAEKAAEDCYLSASDVAAAAAEDLCLDDGDIAAAIVEKVSSQLLAKLTS